MDIGKVTYGNFGFLPTLNPSKNIKRNELKNTNNEENSSESIDDEKKEALKKLDKLIRSVLNLQNDQVLNNVEYGNTPGWDSMAQFQLVAEIEDAFKISFTSYQLEHATSYKSLSEIVLDNFS